MGLTQETGGSLSFHAANMDCILKSMFPVGVRLGLWAYNERNIWKMDNAASFAIGWTNGDN